MVRRQLIGSINGRVPSVSSSASVHLVSSTLYTLPFVFSQARRALCPVLTCLLSAWSVLETLRTTRLLARNTHIYIYVLRCRPFSTGPLPSATEGNMQPSTSPSDFIYRRPFNILATVERRRSPPPSDMEHVDQLETPGNHDTVFNTEQVDDCDRTPLASRATMSLPVMLSDSHHEPTSASELCGLSLPHFRTSGIPIRSTPARQPQHTTRIPRDETAPGASHLPQEAGQLPEQKFAPNGDEDRRPSNTLSTTDSTISRTLSIYSTNSEHADRLCAAVGAVHDICLQATKTYLSSHKANHQARASRFSDPPGHPPGSRGDEGENKQDILERAFAGLDHISQSQQPDIPDASDSLLQNISGICNMLWLGSQRDRLLVLSVERIAVDNMARLLTWAEMVALGDRDEWTLAEHDALMRVLDAGRNLCAWLGVKDSIRDMETLEAQLKG